MKLFVLGALFVGSFVQPVNAQDASPPWAPEMRGGAGAPFDSYVQATYDVGRGEITRMRRFTGEAAQIAMGAAPCYDNSRRTLQLPDGQYIVSNSGEELLNWGVKNCQGASLLRRMTIQYGTEELDRSAGGPGAALGLALYSGTTGFGVVGVEIYRQTFVGLPGRIGNEPNFHAYVDLEIDFTSAPLHMDDAPFGWGFLQLDGGTGPVSVVAPRRLLGTVDAMDVYHPGPADPSTYVGTFNFGGCPLTGGGGPCANMYLQLDEVALNEVASTRVINGSGTNPVIFHEIFPARLGHTWSAWIDAQVPGVTLQPYTLLLTSVAQRNPVNTPAGQLLIDLNQRIVTAIPGEAAYTQVIPPVAALAGVEVFLQGVVLPPASTTMQLTNALGVRIGY